MSSWASFIGYVQEIGPEDREVLQAFTALLTSGEEDLREQAQTQIIMLYEVLRTRRGWRRRITD